MVVCGGNFALAFALAPHPWLVMFVLRRWTFCPTGVVWRLWLPVPRLRCVPGLTGVVGVRIQNTRAGASKGGTRDFGTDRGRVCSPGVRPSSVGASERPAGLVLENVGT
jgi:hypothetical protein